MWDAHPGFGAASNPCGAKNSSLRSHLVALRHLRPAFFVEGAELQTTTALIWTGVRGQRRQLKTLKRLLLGWVLCCCKRPKVERVIERRAVFSRLRRHFCYGYGRRLSGISPYARSILRTVGRPVWPAWGGQVTEQLSLTGMVDIWKWLFPTSLPL